MHYYVQSKKQKVIFLLVVTFCAVGLITQLSPNILSKESSSSVTFVARISSNTEDQSTIIPSENLGQLYNNNAGTIDYNMGNTIDDGIKTRKEIRQNTFVKENEDFRNFTEIWTYKCDPQRGCIRTDLQTNEIPVEPEVCWLNCGDYGAMWPYPEDVDLGRCLTPFYYKSIRLQNVNAPNQRIKTIFIDMWKIFLGRLTKMSENPENHTVEIQMMDFSHNSVSLEIIITEESDSIMDLDTDESYTLNISTSNEEEDCKGVEINEQVKVQISSYTVFGARHGLETLLQLIAFDGIQKCFQIVSRVNITDGPAYPYRGLLIDTSRNFLSIQDMERMIDGMSINKLSTLHWHMTDSNSFPFFSKQIPEMVQYGSYSLDKIYYPKDIKRLKQYAKLRGVRLIVELDAPAHAEPWRSFCGQPPCGQLNPLNNNTYIVLGKLYEDLMEAFADDEVADTVLFHMGGDEVFFQCWESDPNITDWILKNRKDMIHLWGLFMMEALKHLKLASESKLYKAIVWTSSQLSNNAGRKFMNASDYIIQVWDGNHQVIRSLISENYSLIMSNVDSMYLDMGAGTWLGRDHIYAYAYWQKLYDNSLSKFINNIDEDKQKRPSERKILGSEATLWSEKINSQSVDFKTWPRGCALAENVWSDPPNRPPMVYSRLNHHNRRMIKMGIHSDQLQPEWCYLSLGHCDESNPSKRI